MRVSTVGLAVGGTSRQHEPPVAIAAVHETLVVNLQIDARMAKRSPIPVTGDAGGFNTDCFGWLSHRAAL